MIVKCDYCGENAELVTGKELYPHRPDLSHVWAWRCVPCNASVGCHKNSSKHAPLGRLATAELKRLKMKAHEHFDKLWKSKEMSRSKAYQYLADRMGIEKKDCHIGMFDEQKCRKVIHICMQDYKVIRDSLRKY